MRRQHALPLLVVAEHHHRIEAEDVHVHGGGAREPGARFGNRLHHHRRLADAESRSAVRFRHRDAEPAVARTRLVEIHREFAILVAREPVLVAEAFAQLLDRFADAFLLGRRAEIHF